jgi:hypothetical protein
MIHDEVRNVIKAASAVTGPSGVGMITEHGAPTPLILKLEDRFPAIERGERADRRRCIFATRWQAAVTGPQARVPCRPNARFRQAGSSNTSSSLVSTHSSLDSLKVKERGSSTNGILDYGRQHQIRVFSAALRDNPVVFFDSQKSRANSTPASVAQSSIVAHGSLLAVRDAHRRFVWLWHAGQRRQTVQGSAICCLV